MAAAVFTVVRFERGRVGTRSFQTGVVVSAPQHQPPGAGSSHSPHFLFSYPPACSHSHIWAVLPRSWREMKALRAKLVIRLLPPSWSCMWTRPRNFLWVILLPAVPTQCFMCPRLSWATTLSSTCLLMLKPTALPTVLWGAFQFHFGHFHINESVRCGSKWLFCSLFLVSILTSCFRRVVCSLLTVVCAVAMVAWHTVIYITTC